MVCHAFHTRDNSGAALVIAVGILTVLLVIALSFFQITREEIRSADNYSSNIHADMLADGAIALATAFLQHDERIHPTATSLDFAFRTYFDGTWAGGKRWTWPVLAFNDPADPWDNQRGPTLHGYPPTVNLELIDYYRETVLGLDRLNLRTTRFNDLMYIPRIEDNSNLVVPFGNPTLLDDIPMVLQGYNLETYITGQPASGTDVYPYLISSDWDSAPIMDYRSFFGLFPEYRKYTNPSRMNSAHELTLRQVTTDGSDGLQRVEQVHFFSDVDLDGDGYNDAIWIPISADRMFPNDGLDNDLDGFVDAEDLDGEPGLFMYRNTDGDVVFTMPIDKMFSIYIPATGESIPIYNPDTDLGLFVSHLSYQPNAGNAPNTENAPYTLNTNTIRVDGNPPLRSLIGQPGERITSLDEYFAAFKDDDYSGIVNDGVDAGAYLMNEYTRNRLSGVPVPDTTRDGLFYFYGNLISRIQTTLEAVLTDPNFTGAPAQVRALGEPASEIVARIAVHISDEAGKANVNEAGGRTYLRGKGRRSTEPVQFWADEVFENVHRWPLFASISAGRGPEEYELSVLPNMSQTLVDRVWNFKTGAPGGIGLASYSNTVLDPFSEFDELTLNGQLICCDDDSFLPDHQYTFFRDPQHYYYDVSLPGYGRVDDNGNAFLLAFNGIDDDGDAIYYQTDGIDNNMNFNDGIDNDFDGLIDEAGEHIDEPGEGLLVGTDEGFRPWNLDDVDADGDGNYLDDWPGLEGIDEPWELQRYRPYRHIISELEVGVRNPNPLASDSERFLIDPNTFNTQNIDEDLDLIFDEDDTIDNDGDASQNEIGELGDRPYRTVDQLTLARDIDGDLIEGMAPLVTAHSTDRNLRYSYRSGMFGALNAANREVTGQKLDYNFADAASIAEAMLEDWDYEAYTIPEAEFGANLTDGERFEIQAFAAGLRQEDANRYGDFLEHGSSNSPGYINRLHADRELRAHQLATNIKDFVDTNHSRSELQVDVVGLNGDNADPFMEGFGAQHEMYYTQTGIEAIRINEIMVRPTRRVEAEALPFDPNNLLINPFVAISEFYYSPPIFTNLLNSATGLYRFNPNVFSLPNLRVPGTVVPDFDFYVTRTEDVLQNVFTQLNSASLNYRLTRNTDFGPGSLFENNGTPSGDYWRSPTTDSNAYDQNDFVFSLASMLGLKSAWTTYESTIPAVYQIYNGQNTLLDERAVEIPNIIQFSFKASPQLPAGRYYLTLNTLFADHGSFSSTSGALVNTVTDVDDYAFFFRLGRANEDVFSLNFADQVLPNFSSNPDPYPALFYALHDSEESFWTNPAVLGEDGLGNLTGSSFMQASSINTTTVFNPSASVARVYGSYGGPGFTIEIPDIGDNIFDPMMLHVAVWKKKGRNNLYGSTVDPLAVNYFEFSQEPDHEWVELAHVDPRGEPVDLSNWLLVVENMDPPREMVIPEGTVIAPGGYLLLGTDRTDDYAGEVPPVGAQRNNLRRNGIGLTGRTNYTSVPPTAPPYVHPFVRFGYDYTRTDEVVNPFTNALRPDAPFNLESVFYPFVPFTGERLDLIDNNGDGLEDRFAFDANDGGIRWDDVVRSNPDSNQPYSAFDRIVQLSIPGIEQINTAAEIGELVLQGGFFPNYPERDGWDNDGDRFHLENDDIDNDGDYHRNNSNSISVLEQGNKPLLRDGIDEGVRVDMATESSFVNRFARFQFSPNRYLPAEGTDEGRWRRFNPTWYQGRVNVPGAFMDVVPSGVLDGDGRTPFSFEVPLRDGNGNLQYSNGELIYTRFSYGQGVNFLPGSLDNLRWKEFVDRRLFPGDNVIITLYEAPSGVLNADVAKEERVVDRVTYTERDVVNRNIDDVRPFFDGTSDIRTRHNQRFNTIWPEDTMGIDFYRSLERKHPLYNGDRFGTRNRFQVTDGNYDDWAESTGLWQRINQIAGANEVYSFFNLIDLDGTLDIDLGVGGAPNYDIYRQFAHAYHGSPLRMNYSQRRLEDPVSDRISGEHVFGNTTRRGGQFFHADGKTKELPEEYRWPWLKPRVPNKLMTSPGDLMALSRFEQDVHFERISGDWWIGTELNAGQSINFNSGTNTFGDGISYWYSRNVNAFPGDLIPEKPVQANQILLSHRFRNDFRDWNNSDLVFAETETHRDDLIQDLHAVIGNGASTDTVSLQIGRAEPYPLTPETASLVDWSRGDLPPDEWSPVFLFELPEDASRSYPYRDLETRYDIYRDGTEEAPYLLNGAHQMFTNSMPPGVMDYDRWPLPLRAVLFASRNTVDLSFENSVTALDPATRLGASAFFVWDGDDGLENGEYDLFVELNQSLTVFDALQQATAIYTDSNNQTVSTVFGQDFVDVASRADFDEMRVDIEVFTDKDGNGATWSPVRTIPQDYRALNSGSNLSVQNESLGQIQDVVPDLDGFVHYGPVRIENNLLGVFIRNRASQDVVNRITRVVLTPRNKTAGRININTTETRIVGATASLELNDSDVPTGFLEGFISNPLMGLPGVLLDYDPRTYQMGRDMQEVQESIGPPRRDLYVNFIGLWRTGYRDDSGFQLREPDLSFPEEETIPALRTQVDAALGQSAAFRAHLLTQARPDNADGRYYKHISELIAPIIFEPKDDLGNLTGELAVKQSNALSEFTLAEEVYVNPFDQTDVSLNEDSLNWDESYERFKRLANLITTRASVFEIKVRVQTGYVLDENGDGIENYRDNNEFTVTGEKDARAVYER